MWDRKEIKAKGKALFKANYWACVIVAIILAVAVGGGSSSSAGSNNNNDEQQMDSQTTKLAVTIGGGAVLVGLAVQILALNPLEVGCKRFFIENSKEGQEKAKIDEVLYFFKEGRWGNTVKVMFLYKLYIVLWTLLLIVPGFIKALEYKMVPYLLNENPDITPKEAFARSKELMNGQKMNVFKLDLSFIGWYFLGALTVGILLVFYVNPWVDSTDGVLFRTIGGEYV